MSLTKPIIKLKTRLINGRSEIYSDSPEADALFRLLKRKHLSPMELPEIAKMGFDINICGEKKQLKQEMTSFDVEVNPTYY